jgi:hypothetical protein
MTSERDFDRLARAWLDLGPDEAPDRVIATVLQAAETTPQVRSRIRRPLWRSPIMTRYVAAAGLAAAIILAVGGGLLLTGSNQAPVVVAPSTAPSASATSDGGAVPTELQARWMSGHREPFGTTAGSSLLIEGNGIALSQSNSNQQVVLNANATTAGSGRLRLEQPTLNSVECRAGDVGQYSWSLSASGRTLTIEAIDDACGARPALLAGTWWQMNCADPNDNCLGDVDAGTYASQFVTPRLAAGASWEPVFGALTYTVPDGWANSADWPTTFTLTPSIDYVPPAAGGTAETYHGIYVFTDPAISSQDLACSASEQRGVGRSVDEMIAFIKTQKSLRVGDPSPIVIDGHQGQYLDLSLSPTWNKACPDANGVLSAPVLREAGNVNGWDWRMSAPEKWRLILLDLGGGKVVTIILDDSSSPSRFDDLVAQAMPIVESFTFK